MGGNGLYRFFVWSQGRIGAYVELRQLEVCRLLIDYVKRVDVNNAIQNFVFFNEITFVFLVAYMDLDVFRL